MVVVKEGAERVEAHGVTMMRLNDRGLRSDIFALPANFRHGPAALCRSWIAWPRSVSSSEGNQDISPESLRSRC